jgi:crotonobetainyl-CoA:carnitine CoA-transferase CaiB-like acyl-CoA transferase
VLEGIKVLDIGNNIAGPCVATILAGLRADVLKVERPRVGDDSRAAPPYLGRQGITYRPSGDPADKDIAVAFLKRNRGKRSIELDLRDSNDAKEFWSLVEDADVLVENFRPGTLDRLGFGFDLLQQRNPGLIICSVTGFGQSGPLAAWSAYDSVIRSLTGLMRRGTMETDGFGVVAVADWTAALYGAVAVLAALHQRSETGRGVLLDVSMLEASLSMIWESNLDLMERMEGVSGSSGLTRRVAPWNTYQAKDGPVFLCTYTDRQWSNLSDRLDITDVRFATRQGRLDHWEALDEQIASWTRQHSRWEVARELQACGVPASPVLKPSEVALNPQVQAREAMVPVAHPDPDIARTSEGESPLLCGEFPIWASGYGHLRYLTPAPELGSAVRE